jgi:ArsR family transcriptional regulator, arsenate/arsenite/antimonite-responsive transcriptional repressor
MTTARSKPADAACCATVTEAPLAPRDAGVLAEVYAALGDPVRLRLLSLIAANGEVCSCDLIEPLAKSQPTISHHTKLLAEAGLVVGDKRGRWTYWRVHPDRTDFVHQVLEH